MVVIKPFDGIMANKQMSAGLKVGADVNFPGDLLPDFRRL